MKVDIAHLARLARLSFTEEETARYAEEMQRIVDMVSTLPPAEGDLSLLNPQNPMRMRPDVVAPSFKQEQVIGGAAVKRAGCIVVPKTVE